MRLPSKTLQRPAWPTELRKRPLWLLTSGRSFNTRLDEPWRSAADKLTCDGTAAMNLSLERVVTDERSDGSDQKIGHHGGDRNGGRIRPTLRARPPRRLTCDGDRTPQARHVAPEAEGGPTSRLRGLLRTRRATLGSGCSGLLPRCLYRSGTGRNAPQDNRGLHDRVRASSPQQQPRPGVLIPEREWRGPNRAKSDGLRSLQRRGREGATRGWVPRRVHLPTRVHLPRGAPER